MNLVLFAYLGILFAMVPAWAHTQSLTSNHDPSNVERHSAPPILEIPMIPLTSGTVQKISAGYGLSLAHNSDNPQYEFRAGRSFHLRPGLAWHVHPVEWSDLNSEVSEGKDCKFVPSGEIYVAGFTTDGKNALVIYTDTDRVILKRTGNRAQPTHDQVGECSVTAAVVPVDEFPLSAATDFIAKNNARSADFFEQRNGWRSRMLDFSAASVDKLYQFFDSGK
jgi:hypothetical protein